MIYQLKYTNEKQAINDLTNKGVLIRGEKADFIQAIVWLGLLVDVQGNKVSHIKNIPGINLLVDLVKYKETETIFLDGYHVDIMSSKEIIFDDVNLVVPKLPKHKFLY